MKETVHVSPQLTMVYLLDLVPYMLGRVVTPERFDSNPCVRIHVRTRAVELFEISSTVLKLLGAMLQPSLF